MEGGAFLSETQPFGKPECESELAILGDEYKEYYFWHTSFNNRALQPEVFLIVGRRGSGKTALSQYFKFQNKLPNAIAIDVDEPNEYQNVLEKITLSTAHIREIIVPNISKLWEYVIWSIIFHEFCGTDSRISTAYHLGEHPGKISYFISSLFQGIIGKLVENGEDLAEQFRTLLNEPSFKVAKEAVLDLAKTRPIIVAFDTLENYNVHDHAMMYATAALINCASKFNRDYAHKNIHLKIFIMGEVFPYIKEDFVLNTIKDIREELYLRWKPKDLMRMICWRLYCYLESSNHLSTKKMQVDWESYHDVRTKVWNRFFGEYIVNGRGIREETFTYVLSHTQLRPRQLIILCNAIARFSHYSGSFPYFSDEHIIKGIKYAEENLASEVCNSYSSVYPNVGQIIEALSGLPVIFTGKSLDRVGPRRGRNWPNYDYDSLDFRRLVVELGIVGKIRELDNDSGFVKADFEYFFKNRMIVTEEDDCVIHPLFHKKLNIKVDNHLRVIPFPDHEEFREVGLL